MQPESDLTCPRCGASSRETMPTDAYQQSYECPASSSILCPLPGDCCVFFFYGTVSCPPKRADPECRRQNH